MKRLKVLSVLPLLLAMAMVSSETGELESYSGDVPHSSIGFSVKHMVVATVKGNFRDYDISVSYDPDDLANSSVQTTIKVASIFTDNEGRDNHLRSAEFFDAENYPEINFRSARIENRDDGLVAIGTLTMRGVTREIELPFELIGPVKGMQGEKRYGIDAIMKLNRQDFGVSWNRALDQGGIMVSDMVTVEIHLELVQNLEN